MRQDRHDEPRLCQSQNFWKVSFLSSLDLVGGKMPRSSLPGNDKRLKWAERILCSKIRWFRTTGYHRSHGEQPGATRSARELSAHLGARMLSLCGCGCGISLLQEWSRRGLCRTRDRRRSFFLRLSSLLRVSSRICSMLLHFPSHRSDAVRHSSVDRSCRWLFLVLTGASAIFSLRLLLAADRYFSCPFPSPLRQFVDSTIVHQEPSYFLCLLFMLINVAITRQDLPEWSWVFILDRNKSYYLCTYLCVSLWKWSCITEVIRRNAISRLISSRITLESMIVRAKSSLVHFL